MKKNLCIGTWFLEPKSYAPDILKSGARKITEARKVIAACVKRVYDNVKYIIHLGRRPLYFESLGFSLSTYVNSALGAIGSL